MACATRMVLTMSCGCGSRACRPQATCVQGPKDEPPVRVAATWQYPVEQARQSVRDAILERLVHAGRMARAMTSDPCPHAHGGRGGGAGHG